MSVLLQSLCPETPASFRSPLALGEAVTRLRRSVPRSRIDAPFSDVVIGDVSISRVALQRRHRLSRSNSPVQFVGSFQTQDNVTVLSGVFQLRPGSRVLPLLLVLIGLVGLLTALSIAPSSTTPSPPSGLANLSQPSLALLVAGLLLPRVLLALYRSDRTCIAELISAAFHGPEA
jgi:hypothetical protein